jgi:hypothetical protein
VFKAADKWLVPYLRRSLRLRSLRECPNEPRHLIFCVVDHFEPWARHASEQEAADRVARWVDGYPRLFGRVRDADGRPPRHTFFCPQDEYDADAVERIRELVAAGYGEVEVHLHHRADTPQGLRSKLEQYRDELRARHGLLGSDREGRVRYGFAHGNWALCNSRPDGDWCGVNGELAVLAATGCYADFTFPSAPSPTQPRTVNSIYYATDGPDRPRSHDRGVPVRAPTPHSRNSCVPRAGGMAEPPGPAGRNLMLIQGPLALNWRSRKWGLLPRLENAAIAAANPPSPQRIRLWVGQRVHVCGRPEWIFVKVHTHGAAPENAAVLLGNAMRSAHEYLQWAFNDGRRWRLHYVTAREMYNIVRAAEAGETGDPGRFRDYEIGRPPSAP